MVVAEAVAPSAPFDLVVRESPGRGRGVFASRAFAVGELLERAPVLVVPRSQVEGLKGTLLDDYFFWWDGEHNAVALGWASLYNHACPANASFRIEVSARLLVIAAVQPIAVGDEVTISYHGTSGDPRPVWFSTA